MSDALSTYLNLNGTDRRLSEAAAALLPHCVDGNAVWLLAPLVASKLTEQPDGSIQLCDPATGRPRFGKRGRVLDAVDCVNEVRAEAERDGDWLITRLFRG